MKNKFTTMLLLLLSGFTFAQEQQIIYLNGNMQEVYDKKSAVFIRTIVNPTSNQALYQLTDTYKNGAKKRVATLSQIKPLYKYEGTLTEYFENGNKQLEENYKSNKVSGFSKSYYQNGNIKEERIYLDNVKIGKDYVQYKTTQFADSLGKMLLDDSGSGTINVNYANGDKESGSFLKGLKNGEWKTYDAKNGESYIDLYDNGIFIKGQSLLADGKVLKYNELEKLPEFKGGLKAFSSFLSQNLSYPSKERNDGIEGRVYIAFEVENDGSLSNIRITKGISEGLNSEALRVIKKSPNWQPGLHRGKPTMVPYVMPIVFKL